MSHAASSSLLIVPINGLVSLCCVFEKHKNLGLMDPGPRSWLLTASCLSLVLFLVLGWWGILCSLVVWLVGG